MTNSPGLRERKKAATRQALHEAAVRLAADRGLDNVTVEAIADAVDLSRRTFSNYFEGKEDAVLFGYEQRLRTLLDLLRARPTEEPAWTALRQAFHGLYPQLGDPDSPWLAEMQLIRQHPALKARQLATLAGFERELTQAVAERIGDEPERRLQARVMAATFLTGVRLSTQLWLKDPHTRSLVDVSERVFDQISAQFREPDDRGR